MSSPRVPRVGITGAGWLLSLSLGLSLSLSLPLAAAAAAAGRSPDWPPEVALFPPGEVPGEVPGTVGPEYWVNKTSRTGYVARQLRNVTAPSITPFLAERCPSAGCPAVVVAPGGAYMLLSFSMEGTDVAERFNAMGVSAFVLKYRVPQRAPQPGVAGRETFGWAPLMDAQRAMGLVRSRAAEWRVDPDKVGFNGFSAGGHLTVHLATSWAARTYPKVDAADELPCRPDFALPIYPWKLLLNNSASAVELAPEVANVSADTPPLMIAQNEDDPSAHVENSLMLYYHLKRSAGRSPSSALHLYPTGGHGFGLCQADPGNKECCEWPLAAQRFLQDRGFAPGWPAAPCDGVYDAEGSLQCR